MEKLPAGHCTLLSALEDTVYEPQQIILRGPADTMSEWRSQLDSGFAPWRTTYAIPYEDMTVLPAYLPKLVSTEQQLKVQAYVCAGLSCSLPIDSLEALQAEIG